MRKATEAEVLALDTLAREIRDARRRTRCDEAITQPIPNMTIAELSDLWWAELAGRTGSR